jgi:outer membrane translocation and assembly module TamA
VIRYLQVPIDPATGTGLYSVEYRPLGGNLRILQNIDLMFPISPPWYGSVFFDNGVVADSLDGLTAARFRHGIGVSPLLIRLPIGDISLAWAWPIDPGPGDTKIGVFHVNVGLLF